MADTGHSGTSVPFFISKSLTGIFPYDSCTPLSRKLTSTVEKNSYVAERTVFATSFHPQSKQHFACCNFLLQTEAMKNGMTGLIEDGETSNRIIMEDEPISRNTV